MQIAYVILVIFFHGTSTKLDEKFVSMETCKATAQAMKAIWVKDGEATDQKPEAYSLCIPVME